MSTPYVGEIRLFAGSFAPAGWALCEGQLLPISENDTLFNLIGTTYGGDGQSTFGLPNLAGRVPVHQGTCAGRSYTLGETAGAETVTLSASNMPAHSHALRGSSDAASPAYTASTGVLGKTAGTNIYALASGSPVNMKDAVTSTGGNQPHENMAPFLTISYIISLFGVYPTQT